MTVPSRLIAEQAEQCGIYFGASRKTVRSEQVKNNLLFQMPQLQWAGVNTSGCVAVITVRERKAEDLMEHTGTVCSIVAARDGIISEIMVLRGNGLCKPGHAVKEGQVLISGYTDCGICIQATRAEGEILAHTQHRLSAVFPEERTLRGEIIGTEEKISLIIGKKQINFSKGSGISGSTCAKIYTENYLTLPGGFRLPIGIATETYIQREAETDLLNDGASQLTEFACLYLTQQMQAGSVLGGNCKITEENGFCRLEGTYSCREMIGRFRLEENLPIYEND